MSNSKYSDIDFLTNYAQELLKPKWGQTAQPAAPVAPTPAQADNGDTVQLLDLAQKMLQQLKDQMNPNSATTDAAIYPKDVKDLPSFIQFLWQEKIQTGGQFIVSQTQSVTNAIPYQIEAHQFESGKNAVWIYKEGLVQYLQQLLQTATNPQNPNDILRVMLQKLIAEANEKLQTNIQPSTTDEPKQNQTPGQPGAPTSGQQNQSGQSGTQQQTGPTQSADQNAQRIALEWPLLTDTIDCERISKWCDAVMTLSKNYPNPALVAVQQAKSDADGFIQLYATAQQSLTDDVQGVYDTLIPKLRQLHPDRNLNGLLGIYLQGLATLIGEVKQALLAFRSFSTVYGKAFQPYQESLEEQISSVANANLQTIANWRGQLHTVQTGAKPGQ